MQQHWFQLVSDIVLNTRDLGVCLSSTILKDVLRERFARAGKKLTRCPTRCLPRRLAKTLQNSYKINNLLSPTQYLVIILSDARNSFDVDVDVPAILSPCTSTIQNASNFGNFEIN